MSKAEKFIKDCTRNCSNELCAVEDRFEKKVISYHEWLTPDQARTAVEIAREETTEKIKQLLKGKAEERALERFPVHEGASKEWIGMHLKGVCAEYIEGYHQAEKDLELSWKDIEKICLIAKESHKFYGFWCESVYQEILKRFKERKKK